MDILNFIMTTGIETIIHYLFFILVSILVVILAMTGMNLYILRTTNNEEDKKQASLSLKALLMVLLTWILTYLLIY